MALVFLVLLFAISPWLAAVALAAALLQVLIGWLNERATDEPLRLANRRSAGAHQLGRTAAAQRAGGAGDGHARRGARPLA